MKRYSGVLAIFRLTSRLPANAESGITEAPDYKSRDELGQLDFCLDHHLVHGGRPSDVTLHGDDNDAPVSLLKRPRQTSKRSHYETSRWEPHSEALFSSSRLFALFYSPLTTVRFYDLLLQPSMTSRPTLFRSPMQILSVSLDPVSTYRPLRYTAKGRISTMVHLLACQHRGVWRHARKRPTRSEEDAGPGAVTVMHTNPVDLVSSLLGAGCDLPWRALVQIDHKDGGRVSVIPRTGTDLLIHRWIVCAFLGDYPSHCELFARHSFGNTRFGSAGGPHISNYRLWQGSQCWILHLSRALPPFAH
ncbi:hypothetical protein FS749_002608 [Ceratobasidium sp. UAMH 11750]|nr:hypothetical protein FS749_002608 [Ceratobasidium sp. UAMH 11750]